MLFIPTSSYPIPPPASLCTLREFGMWLLDPPSYYSSTDPGEGASPPLKFLTSAMGGGKQAVVKQRKKKDCGCML